MRLLRGSTSPLYNEAAGWQGLRQGSSVMDKLLRKNYTPHAVHLKISECYGPALHLLQLKPTRSKRMIRHERCTPQPSALTPASPLDYVDAFDMGVPFTNIIMGRL